MRMTQANAERRRALRLQAIALLVCLLAGPLRTIAAPWLPGGDECCAAGMCKTHKHAQGQRKAELACEHGKNTPGSDCTMKCSGTSKESAVVSPGIHETILVAEIAILEPRESRADLTSTSRTFKNQVPAPPEQPPRS